MVYRQTARSQAVRAESRERILEAARTLLLERGYEATTMQDIVAEAGTSIGNAYFYFGSKERLVTELVEGMARVTLEETAQAAGSLPAGPRRLGAMIAARVGSLVGEGAALGRLLLATEQGLGTIQIVEDLTIEHWIPHLAESLPGRRPAELPAIATAIWGTNRALIQRVLRGRLALDRREAVRFAVRWSLRAMDVPAKEIEAIVRAALRGLSKRKEPAQRAEHAE